MKLSKKGITSKGARIMRVEYGNNEISVKQTPLWITLILNQIVNPLVFILFFAVVINIALGENVEAIAILIVVIVNTLLGLFQEYKAQNTLESLKKYLKTETLVIRDGKERVLNSSEVVVGDRVKFKPGDTIVADGVLIKSSAVTINESILTGESLPVVKTASEADEIFLETLYSEKELVFKGTAVSTGVGEYIVLRVGVSTKFGEVSELIQKEVDQLTPLQKKIRNLAYIIAIFVSLVSVGILLVRLYQKQDLLEAFTLSIALAVSAIPEALVISLSVVLALGMNRLLKAQALVRKPVVAEALGSVTTLCIDKTGTLTLGEMFVEQSDFVDRALAIEAIIASNAKINTTDEAILDWIKTNKLSTSFQNNEFIEQKPFNSSDKFSITIHKLKTYFMGASEQILEYSNLDKESKIDWSTKIDKLSAQGKRVIGIAYKNTQSDDIKNCHWLGILTMVDPVRTDARDALETCRLAGIEIKIITGDNQQTALAVLQRLGLDVKESECMSGKELSALSDEALMRIIKKTRLFYRTSPEQKYKIVDLLKKMGERVAMMGDGVNDAPALKRADVGVVVNNATDVSKQTADMVLLDSNFNTLVNAVEEGRVIFTNMKKVVTYLLADAFSSVILVVGSFMLGLPLPLTALQILFINLIADSLPDIGLAFEPKEKNIMKSSFSKKYSLLNSETVSLIIIIGIVVNVCLLIIFKILIDENLDLQEVRSFMFLTLAIDSLIYVFSIKSLTKNIWEHPIFNNFMLNIGVLIGGVLVFSSFTIKPIRDILDLVVIKKEFVLFAFSLAFIQILLIELTKALFFKLQKAK